MFLHGSSYEKANYQKIIAMKSEERQILILAVLLD